MRAAGSRPVNTYLGLPGLFFVYALLTVLGTLFASSFFARDLAGERAADAPLVLFVFLSIPLFLSAYLIASTVKMVRDAVARRPGGRLRARLLAYFALIALLAAVPVTLITVRFVAGLFDSWYSADLPAALKDARYFSLDSFSHRMRVVESRAVSPEAGRAVDAVVAGDRATAESLFASVDGTYAALQSFVLEDSGAWRPASFAGRQSLALAGPPAIGAGFIARDADRDRDVVRYMTLPRAGLAVVHTFDLGEGYDERIARLDAAELRTEAISDLRPRLKGTLLLLYAAFFLPTLLMAAIIAFSLSELISRPIGELAEATRRVSEGDFSIRILSRGDDELGALVVAFNAMVRDLEDTRASSLRVEKLNVWQDMAQRLAHEIKNPLTPIKLSAERVLRRWSHHPESVDEILEDAMNAIVQEVDGLSAMLSEFRALARMPAPAPAPENVRSLVADAVSLYRSSYPGVDFRCDCIDADLSIMADRRLVSQVLTNLILNAVDAMDGRGTLEIRVDLVKKRDCRYCRLSVRDDGKGIPAEYGAQIFTPYFTTKDAGTGLGLSIVERIVSDHGGSIWFDSAPGVGTTFFIDLPVDGPAAARSVRAREEGSDTP